MKQEKDMGGRREEHGGRHKSRKVSTTVSDMCSAYLRQICHSNGLCGRVSDTEISIVGSLRNSCRPLLSQQESPFTLT